MRFDLQIPSESSHVWLWVPSKEKREACVGHKRLQRILTGCVYRRDNRVELKTCTADTLRLPVSTRLRDSRTWLSRMTLR